MEKEVLSMRTKIKKILDSHLSSYEISKRTGVARQSIDNYRNDESRIDNMTLKNAEKLAKLQEEIKMEMVNSFIELAGNGAATIGYAGDVQEMITEIKKNEGYRAFESKRGELVIYKKEASEDAKKVLNEIKNNEKVYLVKKGGMILKNTDTQNFQTIFGDSYEGEHYFGIYGDVFGGQFDSRDYPEEYIAKRIDMILEQGYELV